MNTATIRKTYLRKPQLGYDTGATIYYDLSCLPVLIAFAKDINDNEYGWIIRTGVTKATAQRLFTTVYEDFTTDSLKFNMLYNSIANTTDKTVNEEQIQSLLKSIPQYLK